MGMVLRGDDGAGEEDGVELYIVEDIRKNP